MDEDEIKAIEARRNTALATSNVAKHYGTTRALLEEDIPALIAEVRRLRAALLGTQEGLRDADCNTAADRISSILDGTWP